PKASNTRPPRRRGWRRASRSTRRGARASSRWPPTRRGWRRTMHDAPPRRESRLHALGEFICADADRAQVAARLFRRGAPGSVESEVRGRSMGDTLPDGARIRIAPDDGERRRGVVVAFFADGRTVVHRVRWRRRGWLITQ